MCNTGKDLSKKSVVNIRYVLGFERVVKRAICNFEKMGLRPVIYRSSVSVLTKRQHLKIGYYGATANKQYEYDHRNDQGIFLNKRFIERKLEVMRHAYEVNKDLACATCRSGGDGSVRGAAVFTGTKGRSCASDRQAGGTGKNV